MRKKAPPPFHPWHPKYWLTWLSITILRLLCLLPYRLQLGLGTILGRLLYYLLKRERQIATINIKLSFPELSSQQQLTMLKRHFTSLGISLFEIGLARWARPKRLSRLVGETKGMENIEQAISQGKGIMLLAPHFTCIQLCTRLFSLYHPVLVLYRPHKKPFVNHFFEKIYQQLDGMISRHQIRQLVRVLKKENRIVCFTPDVDTGRKTSVFAPFFNIPTATSITPAVMGRLTNAIMMPVSCYRLANGKGYSLNLEKPLDNFPSDNVEKDMTRVNQGVEQAIKQHPDQYLWIYKRFKTRPVGENRFY